MADYTDKQISEFLMAANSDLGSNKYKGDDMIPDYAKTVIIGQQLQAKVRDGQKILDWIKTECESDNPPEIKVGRILYALKGN